VVAVVAVAALHSHSNMTILNGITDVGSGAIITSSERSNLHTHSNKALLDTLSDSSLSQPLMNWISGRLYDLASSLSTGTEIRTYANPNGKIIYTPIFIPNDITVLNLHIRNTIGYAGKLGKIAIYSNNINKPKTKLFESSSIALDVASMKYVVCNTVLIQGWYWIAFIHDHTSTVSLEALSKTVQILGGWTSAFQSLSLGVSNYEETFVYGIMPSEATPVIGNAGYLNRIMIEVL
jgi:hypothetical protein